MNEFRRKLRTDLLWFWTISIDKCITYSNELMREIKWKFFVMFETRYPYLPECDCVYYSDKLWKCILSSIVIENSIISRIHSVRVRSWARPWRTGTRNGTPIPNIRIFLIRKKRIVHNRHHMTHRSIWRFHSFRFDKYVKTPSMNQRGINTTDVSFSSINDSCSPVVRWRTFH